MSEQMLERKSIAAAVHQIFPGECMTEHMNTCFQNAALVVIVRDFHFERKQLVRDCQFQGVL